MPFTEFYCQNGGSNLNAGSTTNNTAAYTSTNGNWNGSTIFTPTDGSTPASTVSVGDFASIYLDGATVTVSVSRVTAVAAGANGAITVSAASRIGTVPASLATGRTIKVGGAWQGPNAASAFPLSLGTFGNAVDAASHPTRLNLKNDQTYSITSAISAVSTGTACIVQGYGSSVGDGGKATVDGGTSTAGVIADTGSTGNTWIDVIFTTSITTGATDLVIAARVVTFIRCVFAGARGRGFQGIVGASLIECEAYNCNRSNNAGLAGFNMNGGNASRCISHDNTGSNSSGFIVVGGPCKLQNCISDTNGQYGISLPNPTQNGVIEISNCDIYNNTSDAINIGSIQQNPVWIENTNFIKNGGAGINNASTTNTKGFAYKNGYGLGTQANGSADTLNNITSTGAVTYGSNLTPWVDPANGDFRVNLSAANFAGRGAFTETAASYAGTIGFPDIGAAQSLTGLGGTFSKEVSYGFA